MGNRIITFLTILVLLLSYSTQAQKLSYREVCGDEVSIYDYEIQRSPETIKIQVIKRQGDHVLEDQVFILNEKLLTQKWIFIRTRDNTNVVAELHDDEISIQGVRDGKKIDEDYDLDEYSWIQLWPMNLGLEPFLKSSNQEIKYWAFGTEKPGDLDLAKFVASKEEKELIKLGSEEHLTQKVNITLSGWKSIFWDGYFFFRESDGRIIKYDGDGAPGKPDAVTTLISEE